MAFDFPASPTEGQTFSPSGGPTYVFNSPVWKAVGQGQIASIGDAFPASPANGQLHWESDTGRLWIFYNDGNTAQWVQVSGTQPVNGVVKISSGTTVAQATLDIALPTGYLSFELVIGNIFPTSGLQPLHLRVSHDGSTFATTSYTYQLTYISSTVNSNGGVTGGVGTTINLGNVGASAGVAAKASWKFAFMPTDSTAVQTILLDGHHFNDTVMYRIVGSAYCGAATGQVKAMRLFFGAGNLAAGATW